MTPSRYQIDDIAIFQPFVDRIDGAAGEAIDDTGIDCLITGVTFLDGKVLYDIALPDGEGGFYLDFPLQRVDSYFVVKLAAAVAEKSSPLCSVAATMTKGTYSCTRQAGHSGPCAAVQQPSKEI